MAKVDQHEEEGMEEIEESEANEEENIEQQYYSELLEKLEEAKTDATVFKTLIQEIEDLRMAIGLKDINISTKILMRTLLALPTKALHHHRDKENYFELLAKTINKFQVLLVHYSKWQDATTHFAAGVEEEMKSRLIPDGYVKNIHDVGRLLNIVSTSDYENIKSLLLPKLQKEESEKTLFGKIDAMEIDDDVRSKSTITTPTFTADLVDDNKKLSLHPFCTSKDISDSGPMKCDKNTIVEVNAQQIKENSSSHLLAPKYYYGNFTSVGGCLRHWTTDNYLEVPAGAIPLEETWCIRGKIFTSLDKFDSLLPRGSVRSQFISSVMEFCIVDANKEVTKKNFLHPVKIIIYHSAKNKNFKYNLQVLCMEEAEDKALTVGQIFAKDTQANTNKQPNWFIIHDTYVEIHTYHFTKYVCICHVPDNVPENIPEIKYVVGVVTGEILLDQSFFNAIVSFSMILGVPNGMNSLTEIKEQISQSHRGKKEERFFVEIPAVQLECNYTMCVQLKIHSELQWTDVHSGSDPQEKIYVVHKVFTNLANLTDPLTTICNYLLKSRSPKLLASLNVYFNNPTNEIVSSTTHSFSLNLDEPRAPLTATQEILSEANLYQIANNIRPDDWFQILLRLGLKKIELEHIEADSKNRLTARTIFNALCAWRNKQDDSNEMELVQRLRQVFKKYENTAALEELNSFCSPNNSS